MNTRKRLSALWVHFVLICGVVVFAIPLYGLVATALKSEAQIQDVSSLRRLLIPDPVMWSNFADVFRRVPFLRFFANTLIVVFLNVLGVAIVCPIVAYGFARFRWPGRDLVFFLLLATMMIPPQVTMVPVFLIFTSIGWIDTFLPLWVPAWFGAPFFIFLLRQFFRGIPHELDESAMIDGAGVMTAYWRVLLPQLKPALTAIVLLQTVGVWNDFMGPLIYINSTLKMTLALGLQAFVLNHGSEWPLLFAAATMMTVPVIILFLFTQRFFIEGVTLTGMKE